MVSCSACWPARRRSCSPTPGSTPRPKSRPSSSRTRSRPSARLGEIAASITSLRDPSAVLARTIDEAKRLLHADHVIIHQVRPGSAELADYRDILSVGPETAAGRRRDGQASARASPGAPSLNAGQLDRRLPRRRVVRAHHQGRRVDLALRLPLPDERAAHRRGGAAGRDQRLLAREPTRSATTTAQLLGALASQAAIVLGNARLYEELERRVEAQRSLGEIAARITAIRDPGDVLQRTLDEAVRLLDADGGRIELVSESGDLRWAFGHSAIDLPVERDRRPMRRSGDRRGRLRPRRSASAASCAPATTSPTRASSTPRRRIATSASTASGRS